MAPSIDGAFRCEPWSSCWLGCRMRIPGAASSLRWWRRDWPGGGRRIDFAYPELVFGIEANSVEAHAAREDVQRNAEKANDLLEWWILYFTYDDVHGAPDTVARLIDETMARRRLVLPSPSAA